MRIISPRLPIVSERSTMQTNRTYSGRRFARFAIAGVSALVGGAVIVHVLLLPVWPIYHIPLIPKFGFADCPIIEDEDDWSSPFGSVDILPTLMERLERAVRLSIEREGYTIQALGITGDMGVLETVWLDESASGDRYALKGPKLLDGRTLYKTVDTRGIATFEDGTEIKFRVYFGTIPHHAKRECLVRGVAIQPTWLNRN